MKRCAIEIGDSCHANTSNSFAILLGSDDNERLAVDQTSGCSAGLRCSPIGFIDFHYSLQTFPAGAHHRLTQLVEDQPRRLVTTQPQSPLEAKGTHAVLLAGYVPHRSKPHRQRKMGVLKHGSRQHRNLHPASSAKPKPARNGPGVFMSASRTSKACWPPQLKKILSACSIIRKPSLNFSQSAWILLGHRRPLHLAQVESSK